MEHDVKQYVNRKEKSHFCKFCRAVKFYCSCGWYNCLNDEAEDSEQHRNIMLDKRKNS